MIKGVDLARALEIVKVVFTKVNPWREQYIKEILQRNSHDMYQQ